ncbi:hypothetical protein ALP93_200226 [Pseudomonas syringae pv. helianthi]|nr:hypothetical protein ALP93_200226 [Pseudomonas syringae pv. helianthi]
MIFRRFFLVSISVISVIRSFNLPTILVVLDHRFLQFSSRGVVPLLCHSPYSRSRLVRFLPGKYLVWKCSFRCSNFRPARRSCTCYLFCTTRPKIPVWQLTRPGIMHPRLQLTDIKRMPYIDRQVIRFTHWQVKLQ